MTLRAPVMALRISPGLVNSEGPSTYKVVYSDDGSIQSAITTYVTQDDLQITLGASISRQVSANVYSFTNQPRVYYTAIIQFDFLLQHHTPH